MYYPYLRGKQFELIALREFAIEFPCNKKIIPVIEPVKLQVNGLNNAISVMLEQDIRFAVVLNPNDGDFKHGNVSNDILPLLLPLSGHKGQWIPAYIYNGNASDLLAHACNNKLNNLMIVFPSGVDVNNSEIMGLLSDDRVSFILAGDLSKSRSVRSKLVRLGKAVISLEDRFESKNRNADYAEKPDEVFSDDFAYYFDDNLAGFSDYTPLAKSIVDGGMIPYAIAIHITYLYEPQQINVHHFVSDSNFDQTNVRGKFHEAAVKIAPFYHNNKLEMTPAVRELIMKAESEDGYPGLGYIKKLSIKNHLELINTILSK